MRWYLLAAAVALGCAPGTLEEVRIDPNFEPEVVEAILDGVEEWCRVSAETCLPVSMALAPHEANVRWARAPWRPGVIAVVRWSGPAIWLTPTGDPVKNRRAVAHELGHVFRRDGCHLHEPGALMAPAVGGGGEPCIDDESAAFVCAGCRGTCVSSGSR